MPSFRYQSLTLAGQARQGVVAAADRAAAIRLLGGRGETATVLEAVEAEEATKTPATAWSSQRADPHDRSTDQPWIRRLRRPVASRNETVNLIRELATALEAGLPLMQALRTVRRQASGRAMRAILDHLIARVEAGSTLSQAAIEYGPPFDDLIGGMMKAADASGRTDEILHQLADLLERSMELRREVVGATIYPGIVACLVVVSIIIFVTVLVPRLLEPLAGQFEMPFPTRVVLGAADFFSSYWLYCLIGIVGSWLGWRAWSRLPGNRFRIDRFKLRVPIFGPLVRDVAVARFTRTLGTLVSAGIPILDALRITRDTLSNAAMMSAIDEVQEKVTGGAALAEPLERSGLFPPLLVQVVNLGERTGRLEHMLIHAASAFDRQVNSSIKLFTTALPPVLIIVMAVVGSFVLAAILLPLLELQSAVR